MVNWGSNKCTVLVKGAFPDARIDYAVEGYGVD
jgi:hypothetical protein